VQNFSSVTVSLGAQSITVQGIGESRYGADAGASASLSLSNAARVYLNYDGKFRAAMQSHQGTLGMRIGGASESIQIASLSQPGGRVSQKAEVAFLLRHQGYEIIRMDELIPEARVGLGIEYLLEPINYNFVSIRLAKLFVVGKPFQCRCLGARVPRARRCRIGERRGIFEKAAIHQC
jgi:hypothetical protein